MYSFNQMNLVGLGVQSQVKSHQRLKKWYLIPPCLTLSIIKVYIKGKVEQSREKNCALTYTSAVANEKGALRLPSTTVANFTTLKA